MKLYALRGATTIDENSAADITARSAELMRALLEANGVDGKTRSLVYYIVSSTADVTAFYPARAIRESGVSAPVFSCLEPPIDGSLPMCVRVLALVSDESEAGEPRHVYLRGAAKLREDLQP